MIAPEEFGIDSAAVARCAHRMRTSELASLARPRIIARHSDYYESGELFTFSRFGFYRDTKSHLIVLDGESPVAWIGFDLVRSTDGIIEMIVGQIQGALLKGRTPFPKWPLTLLRTLIECASGDFETLAVQPAVFNPYWTRIDLLYTNGCRKEALRRHQERLKYYYDIVPRLCGFAIASPVRVDAYLNNRSLDAMEMPMHRMVLQDMRCAA